MEGRILKWKVALDDEVKVGQALLELEVTDPAEATSMAVAAETEELAPVSTGLSWKRFSNYRESFLRRLT